MPGSIFYGTALLAAVAAGDVPLSAIDDKVTRILVPMFRAGVMDIPNTGHEDTNVTTPAHNALARTLAAAGTVLLSNKGVLPLGAGAALTSITVIGDAAQDTPYCCGQGSGALDPPYIVTPLAGIIARAGAGVNVTYLPSLPVFSSVTQFFSARRGDHYLDFTCIECSDLYVSLRSEGFLSPDPVPSLECIPLSLWYNAATSSNLIIPSTMAPPSAGYTYARVLGYALPLNYSGDLATRVLELWQGHDTPTGAAVDSHLDYVSLATDATRAEVMAAGYKRLAQIGRVLLAPYSPPPPTVNGITVVVVSTPSSEGSDRADLSLSPRDDAMITSLVSTNPNVIVVLNNPGAVVMPWADDAGAILASWFPGQEMGNALADVLFGDVNPSGRLPITFPRNNSDTPLTTQAQYPGVCDVTGACTAYYSEKLLFGYRFWDAAGIAPRFCFGHGLSFTTFVYSGLHIDATPSSPDVTVTFTVTNTGTRAGKEVPQLYLSFPLAAGEPPQVLRSFSVVHLEVGANTVVTYMLDARGRSIWDVAAYEWAPVHGKFSVAIGASSRDIRLRGTFTM